jgi:hypothetical protein
MTRYDVLLDETAPADEVQAVFATAFLKSYGETLAHTQGVGELPDRVLELAVRPHPVRHREDLVVRT